MKRVAVASATLAGLLLITACMSGANKPDAGTASPYPREGCISYNSVGCLVRVGRYGISCREANQSHAAPPSYSAADIGKPGMPRLSTDRVALVRLIGKYLHAKTVRFAFANRATFVVYDAWYGACPEETELYWQANGAGPKVSNAYYSPWTGDLVATPGDSAPTPGPWCRRRPGVAPCD